MEVETRNDSIDSAEEAMEVDVSDNETNATSIQNKKRKSKSPGNVVKNKLLSFKFDLKNKSNKSPNNSLNKINENLDNEDDVVDISNEVLVGDSNKKRRKSSRNKTKSVRKSVDGKEEDKLPSKEEEEAKENVKDCENIKKYEKEKSNETEDILVNQESANKKSIPSDNDKVSTNKSVKNGPVKDNTDSDDKNVKFLTTKPTKSPNPRKSKTNNVNKTSPASSKTLLTMDKFIIRKKTPEEVEQEKVAKEKQRVDSDECMIIDSSETEKDRRSVTQNASKEGENEFDSVENNVESSTHVHCKENTSAVYKYDTPHIFDSTCEANKKSIKQEEQVKTPVCEKRKSENVSVKSKKGGNTVKDSEKASQSIFSKKTESRAGNPCASKESDIIAESKEILPESITNSTQECSVLLNELDEKAVNPENMLEKSDNAMDTSEVNTSTDSTEVTKEANSSKSSSRSHPTTPAAKVRGSKTPKQRTLEPRRLTPKQLEKQEEATRKREELARQKEEKEQEKEKLRLEKEQKKKQEEEEKKQKKQKEEEERKQKKLEEEEKKRKEREDKEEAKRVEKEAKEKQKREIEEAKKKDREYKEQQRLAQLELKNKEKEAREEEKRKREQVEKEKKDKAAAAFTSFFKPVVSRKIEVESVEPDTVTVEKQMNFMPFQIKGDMRMAPTVRTVLTPKRSALLNSALSTEEAKVGEQLYLKEIKEECYVRGKAGKTWPAETEEEPDVIILESELCEGGEDSKGAFYNYPTQRIKRRAKLLQFHDNRRPPYWGTWSKKTALITGRTPFKQDEKIFEYDVDSDDEWEDEGEGESLRGSDDEKEEDDDEAGDHYEVDNQMFVPHGYLSDEEEREDEDDGNLDPEAHKMKLKLLELEFEEQMKSKTERLKPRVIGCVWLSNSESSGNVNSQIRELLLTRRAWYEEPNIPVIAEVSNPTPQTSSPSVSGDKEATSTNGIIEKVTSIPDCEMTDLIRLVHGSGVSRQRLVREFNTFAATQGKDFSMALISRTIKEIAEYILCPLAECAPNTYPRKVWFVKPEIRGKFALSDLLAYQNSWKFIVEPTTSEKKDGSGGTPTTKKDGQKEGEGGTPSSGKKRKRNKNPSTPTGHRTTPPSEDGAVEEKEVCDAATASPHQVITKFTKVLSEHERLEQLNKTKFTSSSKPQASAVKTSTPETPKLMPKSKKVKLFKVNPTEANVSPMGNKSSRSITPAAKPSPTIKKRATLITLAKPTDAKPTEKVIAAAKIENKGVKTQLNKDIEAVDLTEENSDLTSAEPTHSKGSSGKDEKSTEKKEAQSDELQKTPSDKSGTKRKSSPGDTAKGSGKKSATKAKSQGNVSIMNFITKERPKRKPEEEKVNVEDRKKIKLCVGKNEVKKIVENNEKVIECVDIDSSNDGW